MPELPKQFTNFTSSNERTKPISERVKDAIVKAETRKTESEDINEKKERKGIAKLADQLKSLIGKSDKQIQAKKIQEDSELAISTKRELTFDFALNYLVNEPDPLVTAQLGEILSIIRQKGKGDWKTNIYSHKLDENLSQVQTELLKNLRRNLPLEKDKAELLLYDALLKLGWENPKAYPLEILNLISRLGANSVFLQAGSILNDSKTKDLYSLIDLKSPDRVKERKFEIANAVKKLIEENAGNAAPESYLGRAVDTNGFYALMETNDGKILCGNDKGEHKLVTKAELAEGIAKLPKEEKKKDDKKEDDDIKGESKKPEIDETAELSGGPTIEKPKNILLHKIETIIKTSKAESKKADFSNYGKEIIDTNVFYKSLARNFIQAISDKELQALLNQNPFLSLQADSEDYEDLINILQNSAPLNVTNISELNLQQQNNLYSLGVYIERAYNQGLVKEQEEKEKLDQEKQEKIKSDYTKQFQDVFGKLNLELDQKFIDEGIEKLDKQLEAEAFIYKTLASEVVKQFKTFSEEAQSKYEKNYKTEEGRKLLQGNVKKMDDKKQEIVSRIKQRITNINDEQLAKLLNTPKIRKEMEDYKKELLAEEEIILSQIQVPQFEDSAELDFDSYIEKLGIKDEETITTLTEILLNPENIAMYPRMYLLGKQLQEAYPLELEEVKVEKPKAKDKEEIDEVDSTKPVSLDDILEDLDTEPEKTHKFEDVAEIHNIVFNIYDNIGFAESKEEADKISIKAAELFESDLRKEEIEEQIYKLASEIVVSDMIDYISKNPDSTFQTYLDLTLPDLNQTQKIKLEELYKTISDKEIFVNELSSFLKEIALEAE